MSKVILFPQNIVNSGGITGIQWNPPELSGYSRLIPAESVFRGIQWNHHIIPVDSTGFCRNDVGHRKVLKECTAALDTCGNCTERHRTSQCPDHTNKGVPDHASWSRECPTFLRKIAECNKRNPENSLPFIPSDDGLGPPGMTTQEDTGKYTWKLIQTEGTPKATGTVRQRSQDGTWTRKHQKLGMTHGQVMIITIFMFSQNNTENHNTGQANTLKILQINLNKLEKAHLDLTNC